MALALREEECEGRAPTAGRPRAQRAPCVTAFLLPKEKSCAPFLGRPWKALFYFAHAVTVPGIVRIFHKNVLKYRDSVSARIHSC